jgi:predicted DNA-binding protein with PD1-like motif
MRWAELTLGRSFGVSLDTGEDLIPSLLDFCRSQGVSQGYVPMFIAGMSEAELVGTCEKVVDPFAPVWSSVHLENIEAAGCGTLATDPTTRELTVHIHVSVGLKGQGRGRSHKSSIVGKGLVSYGASHYRSCVADNASFEGR